MSLNSPLISVIIPCYNPRIDFFKEAIESILAQSYENWEAIIVDDGSNHTNRKEIEKYIETINDERISIYCIEKNSGVSVAKNKGIELSKGEIITFLDADDLLLPWDFTNIVRHFLQEPNLLILSSDYLYYLRFCMLKKIVTSSVYNDFSIGTVKEKEVLSNIKEGRYCIFPRLSLKREIISKFTFDERLKRGEDSDLLIWILNNKNLLEKTSILPQAGYLYRFYPSRTRLSLNLSYRLKAIKILEEKYKINSNSLGYKILRRMIDDLYEGKLIKLTNNDLESHALLNSFIEIALCSCSFKEKLNGFKIILKIALQYFFLLPFVGVSFRYYEKLFSRRDNMSKSLKQMFNNHKTSSFNDNKSMYHLLKTERAIF